jgi:hypothetical protein
MRAEQSRGEGRRGEMRGEMRRGFYSDLESIAFQVSF